MPRLYAQEEEPEESKTTRATREADGVGAPCR